MLFKKQENSQLINLSAWNGNKSSQLKTKFVVKMICFGTWKNYTPSSRKKEIFTSSCQKNKSFRFEHCTTEANASMCLSHCSGPLKDPSPPFSKLFFNSIRSMKFQIVSDLKITSEHFQKQTQRSFFVWMACLVNVTQKSMSTPRRNKWEPITKIIISIRSNLTRKLTMKKHNLPAPLSPQTVGHPATSGLSSLPSSQSFLPSHRKLKSMHDIDPPLQPKNVHEQFCN